MLGLIRYLYYDGIPIYYSIRNPSNIRENTSYQIIRLSNLQFCIIKTHLIEQTHLTTTTKTENNTISTTKTAIQNKQLEINKTCLLCPEQESIQVKG